MIAAAQPKPASGATMPNPVQAASGSAGARGATVELLLWLVAAAALFSLSRLVVLPLTVVNWDESLYFLVSHDLLQGHVPYTATFEHRPIALYYVFALAQILFRRRYGVSPEVVPLPLERAAEDADADAVLLIGDRAMRACLPGFDYAFDLGQEWYDWTGLPFVYAVWAVREGADLGRSAEALAESKRRGLARAGVIAHQEAPRLGLDAGFCRRYLSTILHFDLGPRELAGLDHYYTLACELGLAPAGVALKQYESAVPLAG